MNVNLAKSIAKDEWNAFVAANYPPVGAFMQTWEWGEFQRALGRKVERYEVKEGPERVAIFTLVEHLLPFGFSYGYAPRGPVFKTGADTKAALECVSDWARNKQSFSFLRVEPPVSTVPAKAHGFFVPKYYIQPKYNHVISLSGQGDIKENFHRTTRSNIPRAQRRGVRVAFKPQLKPHEYEEFFKMAQETSKRTGGANAYPSQAYFHTLANVVPALKENHDPNKLTLAAFVGYQHGRPAATHFVLFFGATATYLYGASHTSRLNSKVTTVLHWQAMQTAKERGMQWYDLGGVDERRWPTLTEFKKQFRGEDHEYIGNLDLPIRPALYRAYNIMRAIRRSS